MRRLLDLLSAGHQIYTHEAEDGTVRAWDATLGNLIAQDGREPMLFSLVDRGITVGTVCQLYQGIDEMAAMTADVTRPLLFIPFFDECLLIDGWHRLWRAAYLGLDEVLMYLLTQEEADAIRVR